MAKKGRNSGGKETGDTKLWQIVARSIKAYPAPGRASPKESPVIAKPAVKTSAPLYRAIPGYSPVSPESQKPVGGGFDRSTETKLKRGKLPLEGRLDLHGMTQEKAFNALHRFLRRAVADEKRTVLVITGKGLRSEGVLRRMLPLWLEDQALKKHIVAITAASPKDGGSGAFYIRLRKPGRT